MSIKGHISEKCHLQLREEQCLLDRWTPNRIEWKCLFTCSLSSNVTRRLRCILTLGTQKSTFSNPYFFLDMEINQRLSQTADFHSLRHTR